MGLHVYTVHIIHIGIEYTLQGVGFYEVGSWLQSTPKLYACFNNDININDILIMTTWYLLACLLFSPWFWHVGSFNGWKLPCIRVLHSLAKPPWTVNCSKADTLSWYFLSTSAPKWVPIEKRWVPMQNGSSATLWRLSRLECHGLDVENLRGSTWLQLWENYILSVDD